MGIKGTVRRTTDGHLIHANIDTDIIISEEPPTGSTKKPEELYRVIERFAQGIVAVGICCATASWFHSPGVHMPNDSPNSYAPWLMRVFTIAS